MSHYSSPKNVKHYNPQAQLQDVPSDSLHSLSEKYFRVLDDKSDTCHFWYTTAYFKPEKVRQKLCEQ